MAVNSMAVLPQLSIAAQRRQRACSAAGQRWLALPVSVGVLAHGWALVHHAHGPLETLLMVAMTLACAWCIVELVMMPQRRAIVMVLGMSVAMMLVHTAMVMMPGAGAGHTAHLAVQQTASASVIPSGITEFDAAMLAIMAVEYGIAACCALALRRIRSAASQTSSPSPNN